MDSASHDFVLVDTGPLVAVLDTSDAQHEMCSRQLRGLRGSLLTCWPVLTEAAWLLRAFPNTFLTLLSLLQQGSFQLLTLTETDLPDITQILAKYRSLGVQLADACLLHLANREAIETVFTLDRRDFTVLRRAGGKKLRIIP